MDKRQLPKNVSQNSDNIPSTSYLNPSQQPQAPFVRKYPSKNSLQYLFIQESTSSNSIQNSHVNNNITNSYSNNESEVARINSENIPYVGRLTNCKNMQIQNMSTKYEIIDALLPHLSNEIYLQPKRQFSSSQHSMYPYRRNRLHNTSSFKLTKLNTIPNELPSLLNLNNSYQSYNQQHKFSYNSLSSRGFHTSEVKIPTSYHGFEKPPVPPLMQSHISSIQPLIPNQHPVNPLISLSQQTSLHDNTLLYPPVPPEYTTISSVQPDPPTSSIQPLASSLALEHQSWLIPPIILEDDTYSLEQPQQSAQTRVIPPEQDTSISVLQSQLTSNELPVNNSKTKNENNEKIIKQMTNKSRLSQPTKYLQQVLKSRRNLIKANNQSSAVISTTSSESANKELSESSVDSTLLHMNVQKISVQKSLPLIPQHPVTSPKQVLKSSTLENKPSRLEQSYNNLNDHGKENVNPEFSVCDKENDPTIMYGDLLNKVIPTRPITQQSVYLNFLSENNFNEVPELTSYKPYISSPTVSPLMTYPSSPVIDTSSVDEICETPTKSESQTKLTTNISNHNLPSKSFYSTNSSPRLSGKVRSHNTTKSVLSNPYEIRERCKPHTHCREKKEQLDNDCKIERVEYPPASLMGVILSQKKIIESKIRTLNSTNPKDRGIIIIDNDNETLCNKIETMVTEENNPYVKKTEHDLCNMNNEMKNKDDRKVSCDNIMANDHCTVNNECLDMEIDEIISESDNDRDNESINIDIDGIRSENDDDSNECIEIEIDDLTNKNNECINIELDGIRSERKDELVCILKEKEFEKNANLKSNEKVEDDKPEGKDKYSHANTGIPSESKVSINMSELNCGEYPNVENDYGIKSGVDIRACDIVTDSKYQVEETCPPVQRASIIRNYADGFSDISGSEMSSDEEFGDGNTANKIYANEECTDNQGILSPYRRLYPYDYLTYLSEFTSDSNSADDTLDEPREEMQVEEDERKQEGGEDKWVESDVEMMQTCYAIDKMYIDVEDSDSDIDSYISSDVDDDIRALETPSDCEMNYESSHSLKENDNFEAIFNKTANQSDNDVRGVIDSSSQIVKDNGNNYYCGNTYNDCIISSEQTSGSYVYDNLRKDIENENCTKDNNDLCNDVNDYEAFF